MTTPEADPADLAEQHMSPAGDGPLPESVEVPLEAAEADVAEQQAATGPGEHRVAREVPLESDEADAVEQGVVVEQDDEYR